MISRSASSVKALSKSIPAVLRQAASSRQCSLRPYSTDLAVTRGPSRKAAGAVKPEVDKSLRLLHPHVLAGRLTRLANEDKLDEAIHMLQNAPQDASNVATWNTIIWLCLRAGRFKAGYKLYIDMKRRGLRPNTRTYDTMFDGLSRVEDFSKHSVQLENAHSLYESFLKHIEAVKKVDRHHEEIDASPIAFYITVLRNAGDFTKMFQVFNALDDDGPFSATEFHYAKMFTAIAERRTLSPGDTENVAHRNASDAKLLWKQLAKVAERRPAVISSHVVSACLKALSRGRPTDEIFAFDLIRDYLGLSKPGESAPPPKLELQPQSLDAVLSLCLSMQKYRLCIHYCQQVLDRPFKTGEQSIVDYKHMEKLLQAYGHMAASGSLSESVQALETIEWMHRQVASGWKAEQIMPRPTTYSWALMACWRGGDWTSTLRIVELMSGCHREDFTDENRFNRPKIDRRSTGKNVTPDARSMSCIVRAALASEDAGNMRQCVRMFLHFGNAGEGLRMKEYMGEERVTWTKTSTKSNFYGSTLLFSLQKLLDTVLRSGVQDADEEKAWRALRTTLKTSKPVSNHHRPSIPTIEESPLGSPSSLAKTADFVEFDMAKRMTSPRTTRK